MNRRRVLLAGGTVAVGTLAGCLGSAQTQPQDEDASETESGRTITVGKSGETAAEPDLAILQVAVEARSTDAGTVRDDLATRSAALREALVEFGIDEDDISTARYDIHERPVERGAPETATPDDGDEAREATYEGVHALRVEVREVDRVGAVIDTAVDAGADGVDRVEFTLSDETSAELRETALELAMENARAEAEVLAAEADASVVEVRSIESTDSTVRPIRADAALAEGGDGGAGGTEIISDDVTVTAQVRVTYDIE